MDNYPSNANKYKKDQARKAVETKRTGKVISGNVKRKKKSEAKKLASRIFAEDASNVKEYVVRDLVIPGIIDMVVSIIKNGTDILFYGQTKGNSTRHGNSKITYTNYNSLSRHEDRYKRASRSVYDYDDIGFESKGEAEEVLMQLEEIIEQYHSVSVGDYYDACGVTGNQIDNDYGWHSLRSAEVVRGRDGDWYIRLPRARQLD